VAVRPQLPSHSGKTLLARSGQEINEGRGCTTRVLWTWSGCTNLVIRLLRLVLEPSPPHSLACYGPALAARPTPSLKSLSFPSSVITILDFTFHSHVQSRELPHCHLPCLRSTVKTFDSGCGSSESQPQLGSSGTPGS